MRLPAIVIPSLVLASVAVGTACGGSSTSSGQNCPVGAERCACTTGGGCNPGLVCLSQICVSLDGAAGGSSGGGSSGAGASSGSGSGGSASSGTGSGSGSSDGGGGDANVQDVMTDARGAAGVACGTGPQAMMCTASQVCCVPFPGALNAASTCQDARATCVGTPVGCAISADCAQGQVCCATVATGAGYYSNVGCQSSCASDGGTATQREACDINAPACPTGTTCRASVSLTGFAVCL